MNIYYHYSITSSRISEQLRSIHTVYDCIMFVYRSIHYRIFAIHIFAMHISPCFAHIFYASIHIDEGTF
jgi:hypothetical protein